MAYASRHRRSARRLSCEQFEARHCLSGVSFAPHVVIESEANASTHPRSLYVGDLDHDGDMDILSTSLGLSHASYDDEIAWYKNIDGQGTFAEKQVITTEAIGASSVYAADLDGDGDTDVLSASSVDDKIAWYENIDGAGTFGDQQVITAEEDGASSAYAADLDGDGDMDVLSASPWWDPQTEGLLYDKIAWYENIDGAGTFGDRQVITTKAYAGSSMYAADLDGDGDMDVLSASGWAWDDKIAWYENTDGRGTFGQQEVIPAEEQSTGSAHLADLDGDGDMDILSAVSDSIVWYENTDGRGSFEPHRIMDADASRSRSESDFLFASVHAADVDGDGDTDILSAPRRGIVWYENTDGRGGFGPRQTVTDVMGGGPLYAADLDADGDVDVLSRSGGNIAWYEQFELAAGDANRDGQFNQLDIVEVLQSAKYLTAQSATWSEGDWNSDGMFDQDDIVAALQTGNYL